jgi:hypothetical protein
MINEPTISVIEEESKSVINNSNERNFNMSEKYS